MADEADMAQLYQEKLVEYGVSRALQASRESIKCNGRCHNCKEEIEKPKLFCDSDCAEDHHKRSR